MKKRQTKRDIKIAAEKAALRVRIEDIACGAFGWHLAPLFLVEHDLTISNDMGPAAFGRFLCALEACFPALADPNNFTVSKVQKPQSFDIWENPWPKVIDELYERGLRA